MADEIAWDLPPLTEEEDAELTREMLQSAWEGKEKNEAAWRAEGHAVAWIDPHPQWMDLCGWDFYALTEPEHACIRTIRFVLAGGGQIRVQEKFPGKEHSILSRTHDNLQCRECYEQFRYGTRLLVKAETPTGLVQASGRIEGFHYEMNMDAVLLPARHQALADRAARTLRAIGDERGDPDKDNFLALLDSSQGCAFCRRPLRDEVSKLIGIGPDCAKQNGIAHNKAAADAVLVRRHRLLAEL